MRAGAPEPTILAQLQLDSTHFPGSIGYATLPIRTGCVLDVPNQEAGIDSGSLTLFNAEESSL